MLLAQGDMHRHSFQLIKCRFSLSRIIVNINMSVHTSVYTLRLHSQIFIYEWLIVFGICEERRVIENSLRSTSSISMETMHLLVRANNAMTFHSVMEMFTFAARAYRQCTLVLSPTYDGYLHWSHIDNVSRKCFVFAAANLWNPVLSDWKDNVLSNFDNEHRLCLKLPRYSHVEPFGFFVTSSSLQLWHTDVIKSVSSSSSSRTWLPICSSMTFKLSYVYQVLLRLL